MMQAPMGPGLEASKSWNTKNIGLRLAADGAAAATAGVLVAPVITMIDKYNSPLFLSSTLCPLQLLRPSAHMQL
jgi:hypothetical protein